MRSKLPRDVVFFLLVPSILFPCTLAVRHLSSLRRSLTFVGRSAMNNEVNNGAPWFTPDQENEPLPGDALLERLSIVVPTRSNLIAPSEPASVSHLQQDTGRSLLAPRPPPD